jgi:hypothetical protein
MRGAFRPSDCCERYPCRTRNLSLSSKLAIVLFVLLIPVVLEAQTERNSISISTESVATEDKSESYRLGPGDTALTRDTDVGGLVSPEPLSPASLTTKMEEGLCAGSAERACPVTAQPSTTFQPQQGARGTESDSLDAGVKASGLIAPPKELPDRNLDIYYRNRREFSLDVGWHPVNIPFIYDFAVGDNYNMTPLKYTLVPIIASLRWHVTDVGWKWIFRGNMDFTFSGSITAIPRGPETHYYSFDFGIRRNFVYRNWKVVPFFEQRGGAGIINAKEPLGVLWSQGQNLTFTYNMGVGARYNIDSKYSFSAGMNYMHISNGYLSEPQFTNYGINVYGPMFGLDVRLGKPHHASQ